MVPDGEAATGRPLAPLVTVIVATFDSRLTMASALASAQRQTCPDFEVWVVGDACTGDSECAVTALADPRFAWTNLARNSGSQSGPNNEGLRRARGRYVAHLGHDDLWFPWHLATLLEAAARDAAGVASPARSG
jgi:glycosyltransferase involved in cell wall biosynthesis